MRQVKNIFSRKLCIHAHETVPILFHQGNFIGDMMSDEEKYSSLTSVAFDLQKRVIAIRRLGLPIDEITIQIVKDAKRFLRPAINEKVVKEKITKIINGIFQVSPKMKHIYDFGKISNEDRKQCKDWLDALSRHVSELNTALPAILENVEKINAPDWYENQVKKLLAGVWPYRIPGEDVAPTPATDQAGSPTPDAGQSAASAQPIEHTSGQSPMKKKQIHFVRGKNGGIGKTWISYLMAQYFEEMGYFVKCFDIEPLNKGLNSYKSLNKEFIRVIDSETLKVTSNYDVMMEHFLTEDGIYIIDGSQIPFICYINDNQIFLKLIEAGYEVYYHSLIVGDSRLLETLAYCEDLYKDKSDDPLLKPIFWQNNYYGEISRKGRLLKDDPVYKKIGLDLLNSPILEKPSKETQEDLNELVFRGLTFKDAVTDQKFSSESKCRIAKYKFETFAQFAGLGF